YSNTAAPADGLIVQGKVGIGTANPQRPLHVQGEEIHSSGQKAGFSFSNRNTTEFAHTGNRGERWVWFSENNVACLWSGKNVLTVDADGNLKAGSWDTFSSREIKKDIVVLDERGAAEILNGLEPVRYRLIDDESGAEQLGFIAEEVPQAVAGRDRRTVGQARIVAVLTRVVKEQQRRLDELTERLNERS
ncbi:MAG TPA: tail fiber domain-containing protein, partial [Longimicrobium sp.]|nr:tail fiber domain-containing protein [Longimicrobium sp.]